MEKEIDKVLRLFHQEGTIAHEVKEIRQEEDDSRWIVYVELRPGGLQADGLRAEDSPAEKGESFLRCDGRLKSGYMPICFILGCGRRFAQ